MDPNKFAVVLPVIVGGLVCKIMEEEKISDNEAFVNLYNSELYATLEQENTKVWTMSVPRLYEIYRKSKEAGFLELPDY